MGDHCIFLTQSHGHMGNLRLRGNSLAFWTSIGADVIMSPYVKPCNHLNTLADLMLKMFITTPHESATKQPWTTCVFVQRWDQSFPQSVSQLWSSRASHQLHQLGPCSQRCSYRGAPTDPSVHLPKAQSPALAPAQEQALAVQWLWCGTWAGQGWESVCVCMWNYGKGFISLVAVLRLTTCWTSHGGTKPN